MSTPDHYRLIGVPPTASAEQVKWAFRQKSKQCHPDRGGTEAQMIDLLKAYQTLSDPKSRDAYDRWLAEPPGRPTSAPVPPPPVDEAAWANDRRAYGGTWDDFNAWADTQTAAIESTAGGRRLVRAVGGLIVGAVAGAAFGWFFGAGAEAGAGLGALAGMAGAGLSGGAAATKSTN